MMKVEIIRSFNSKKLGRLVKKGEIIKETEDWVTAIEEQGFGKRIIEAPKSERKKPRKKTLKIQGSKIETASIEHE